MLVYLLLNLKIAPKFEPRTAQGYARETRVPVRFGVPVGNCGRQRKNLILETTSLSKGTFTTYKATPNINNKMQYVLINSHELEIIK